MAVADGGPGTAGPGESTGGFASRPVDARQAQQWLLTLLPTFPLLLLVLRLWHLSEQDLATMLLLVQNVNPLGLLTALLINLVWVLPLALLAVGLLGNLLSVSAPDRFDPDRSLLARVTVRTPGWVLAGAVLLALLTWQLRFLPALLMIALAVLGLHTRRRHRADRTRIALFGLALPVVAAALAYAWLGPGIVAAVRADERVTAALLVLPPLLAALLTGPVPRRAAPVLTRWVMVGAALAAPFVLGTIFLRAPVLPAVAVEVTTGVTAGATAGATAGGDPALVPTDLLLGRVINVDDRMTTLLDADGVVRFVPNDQVRAQVLCPETAQVPYSSVRVRGWHVEQTALEWLVPRRPPTPADPRCAGRPA
nr:hypothetical protein [Micromonospora sp. DSM 115978]